MSVNSSDRSSWLARAEVCELLALSFRNPDSRLAEAVASGEWLDAATGLASALGLNMPDGFAAWEIVPDRAGGGLPAGLLPALNAEATRLFVGAPLPTVSPYESVWAARDKGAEPVLFASTQAIAVKRFMASCGVGGAGSANDPLDHVATELEFLQYLASIEAGIVVPASEAVAPAFPGGSAAQAYCLFAEGHFLTFAGRFAALTAESAHLPFYRAASALLVAFAARMVPSK